MLGGLKDKLMEPKLVQTFVDEYHAELQRLQKDARRRRNTHAKERANLERQIARLVDAIAEGTVSELGAIGEKLRKLEARLSDLVVFNDEEPTTIEWHPNAADLYKQKIANLSEALHADPMVRDEASAALRGLVDRIIAHPAQQRGQFELELHGQLAEAMNLTMHDNVGGGRGIRTLDTVTRIHAFQACAFSHSATPPARRRVHSRTRPVLATAGVLTNSHQGKPCVRHPVCGLVYLRTKTAKPEHGAYKSMIILRVIGWILVIASVVLFARDILTSIDAGTLILISAGELWFRLDNGSLNLMQAVTQRYVLPALWDPVVVTILLWPATMVLGIPGILLVRLTRKRVRREGMFK